MTSVSQERVIFIGSAEVSVGHHVGLHEPDLMRDAPGAGD
jgi:hypothetical protein